MISLNLKMAAYFMIALEEWLLRGNAGLEMQYEMMIKAENQKLEN